MNDQSRANARQTGPALEAHYQFILWLVPTLERFPRSQKFLLGDRIQSTALNGTGYKGDCSHRDANTGEIRVTGENIETQVWRHRGGAGSFLEGPARVKMDGKWGYISKASFEK